MTYIFIILFAYLNLVQCRIYDTRNEIDFDYVNVYDKRKLSGPSKEQQHNYRMKRETTRLDEEFKKVTNRTEKLQVSYNNHIFGNDANNIAFVFWKSANTKVIFILTCHNASTQSHSKLSNKGCHSQSNFYRSTNLGASYDRNDGEGTPFKDHRLHSIYLSPLNKSFIIITDYITEVLFITNDEGVTYQKITPGFSPTYIYFHPKSIKMMAAFDNTKKSLWISSDGGVKWTLVMKNVRNYFWDEQNVGSLYVEKTFNEENSILYHVALEYPTLKTTQLEEGIMKNSVYVGGNYILLQKGSQKLYVGKAKKSVTQLDEAIEFTEATYDLNGKKHNHHVVFSSDNNELVVGVMHPDDTVSVYLSDESGANFRKLTDKVIMETFDINIKSKIPKIDFYRVKGTTNTYIVNRIGNGTLISFNKGYSWGILKYHDNDLQSNKISPKCRTTGCYLSLYIKTDKEYTDYTAPLLSKDSAPGIVLAQGIIGGPFRNDLNHPINAQHHVYISTDGGHKWKRTLESNFGFALLDHGNLIAATQLTFTVKHNIRFSDNFGKSWFTSHFNDYYARIAAIITDSTAKTLVLNVFGFLHQQAENSPVKGDTWIVWRFNFTNFYDRTCKAPSDYKMYPADPPCILGEKTFYQRTKRFLNESSICYSPPRYNDSHIVTNSCKCDKLIDIECDQFFVRVPLDKDFNCKPLSEDHSKHQGKCDATGKRTVPSGYRKKHGNKCKGGVENIVIGKTVACNRTYLPSDIEIRASRISVGVEDPIIFSISKYSLIFVDSYRWDFGDNKTIKGSYEEIKRVQHTYYAHGHYTVKLIARNEAGSYTTSLIVLIIDKTYHNAFIEFNDPAILKRKTSFMLQRYGSTEEIVKVPRTKFLWSFQGIFQGGTESTKASYTFNTVGEHEVEVQVVTPVNLQTIRRIVHVYENAFVIEFTFSLALDTYNTKTVTWMHNFLYKLKMFLSIKYEIHDSERLLIKGEPSLPTTVKAIICDTPDTINKPDKSAIIIARKIIRDIEMNQPMLHGIYKDIHITKAKAIGFLSEVKELKGPKLATKKSTHIWIYIMIMVIIIIVLSGGTLYCQYRRTRTCFFLRSNKNIDNMQKKLVFDVDEDCVGMDGIDLPAYAD